MTVLTKRFLVLQDSVKSGFTVLTNLLKLVVRVYSVSRNKLNVLKCFRISLVVMSTYKMPLQ